MTREEIMQAAYESALLDGDPLIVVVGGRYAGLYSPERELAYSTVLDEPVIVRYSHWAVAP